MSFELHFGVKIDPFRDKSEDTKAADLSFSRVRGSVLRRDKFACAACGCLSIPSEGKPSGGLEVHHINDNHNDNRMENLITLCPLCHGILHIGFTVRSKPGTLVWLPEIAQRDLNILTHVSAITRFRCKDIKQKDRRIELLLATIENLYKDFLLAGELPEMLFYDSETKKDLTHVLISDPESFAAALSHVLRTTAVTRQQISTVLFGLRYLYHPNADENASLYSLSSDWLTGPTWMSDWKILAMRVYPELARNKH